MLLRVFVLYLARFWFFIDMHKESCEDYIIISSVGFLHCYVIIRLVAEYCLNTAQNWHYARKGNFCTLSLFIFRSVVINCRIFHHPSLSLNMTFLSDKIYLAAHYKIKTVTTTTTELFVALVSIFQPISNVKKASFISVLRVLKQIFIRIKDNQFLIRTDFAYI